MDIHFQNFLNDEELTPIEFAMEYGKVSWSIELIAFDYDYDKNEMVIHYEPDITDKE